MFSLPLMRFPAVCILTLLLAGCGPRTNNVSSGVATQTLHLGNAAEPATLDPHIYNMMAEWMIFTALFEGLTNLANDGTTILPGVAERWTISTDGLVYTFHLRANARWSNGDLFTADDYVASVRRSLNPTVATTDPTTIDCVAGARDFLEQKSTDFSTVGLRALNPQTVEYRLAYPAPYFLTLVSNSGILGLPIHPPSVEKFGGKDRRDGKWTSPGNLVGNGPFVLKAWRANQAVVVTRNEHYWDAARVRLKEVHFHAMEEGSTEERAFRTGQLHATWGIPASKLPSYQQTRPAEVARAPVLHTQTLTFNCSRPPFSDVKVRRALALATDRARATEAGFRDRAQISHSFVRPGTGGFKPPSAYPHDPAAARKLLAEAGFPEGRGFPKVELRIASGGPDLVAVAEVLQQMWKQHLGVEVAITTTELKTLIGTFRSRDFDLGLIGQFYVLDDPSDPMATRAGKGNSNNLAHWTHPRFETGLADLRRAQTATERFALFTQLENLLAAEIPYLPLFHADRVHLLHPSVKGWRGNRFAIVDWRELWLE